MTSDEILKAKLSMFIHEIAMEAKSRATPFQGRDQRITDFLDSAVEELLLACEELQK